MFNYHSTPKLKPALHIYTFLPDRVSLHVCTLKGGASRMYRKLHNELCKTRVLIGLEECVIRV